jgi:hypothetical protein
MKARFQVEASITLSLDREALNALERCLTTVTEYGNLPEDDPAFHLLHLIRDVRGELDMKDSLLGQVRPKERVPEKREEVKEEKREKKEEDKEEKREEDKEESGGAD